VIFRRWLAWRKSAQILRIPAGDPADAEDCECGGNFLLTESSIPIQTEVSEFLSPEA
jgi:hypothetical protein